MAQREFEYPFDGSMDLVFSGNAGRVSVETDPNATGAKVLVDGSDEALNDIRINHDNGHLGIQANSPGGTQGNVFGNVSGSVVIGSGSVYVNGVRVTGNNIQVGGGNQRGISHVRVVLPVGSNADIQRLPGGSASFAGEFTQLRTSGMSGGDITTSGSFQQAHLRTSGGDIRIQAVHPGSHIDAKTSGGDVRAEEFFGSGSLKTSGGDITVKAANPEGSLEAKTSGGDVNVTAVNDPDAMNRCQARTSGGRAKVHWGGTYTPRYTASPVRDQRPQQSFQRPTTTRTSAARQAPRTMATPPPRPAAASRPQRQAPPPRQPEPTAPFLRPTDPGPGPEDIMRIERGKQQAYLAEQTVEWGRLHQVIAAAHGQAKALRGSDVQTRVAAFNEWRVRLAEGLNTDDFREIGAAFVAFNVGWVQGCTSEEIYEQVVTDPGAYLGMPADIQSTALVKRMHDALPDELRETLSHNRVVVSSPMPTQLCIETLPVRQPTVQLVSVMQAGVNAKPASPERMREDLAKLDARPGLYTKGLQDGIALPGSGAPDRDAMELLTAVGREAAACYPPITASGELMQEAPVRILDVVHSANASQLDTNRFMETAKAACKRPTKAAVYTPDGANFTLGSTWQNQIYCPVKYVPKRSPEPGRHDNLIDTNCGAPSPSGVPPAPQPGFQQRNGVDM